MLAAFSAARGGPNLVPCPETSFISAVTGADERREIASDIAAFESSSLCAQL
jgi:hypothetical protein